MLAKLTKLKNFNNMSIKANYWTLMHIYSLLLYSNILCELKKYKQTLNSMQLMQANILQPGQILRSVFEGKVIIITKLLFYKILNKINSYEY